MASFLTTSFMQYSEVAPENDGEEHEERSKDDYSVEKRAIRFQQDLQEVDVCRAVIDFGR